MPFSDLPRFTLVSLALHVAFALLHCALFCFVLCFFFALLCCLGTSKVASSATHAVVTSTKSSSELIREHGDAFPGIALAVELHGLLHCAAPSPIREC